MDGPAVLATQHDEEEEGVDMTFENHSMVGGWLGMGFIFLVICIVIFGAIAVLGHDNAPPQHPYKAEDASEPRRHLEEDFAKGEIEEDDYLRQVSVLPDK
jgi:uncharacterized membrane protein